MWDPPVLIPNTEVKPHRADGTVRDTVWESRSLPHFTKGSLETEVLLLVYEGQRTRFARKALNDRAVLVMGWRIAGLMATTCSVTYSASHYRLLGYGGMLPRLLSP